MGVGAMRAVSQPGKPEIDKIRFTYLSLSVCQERTYASGPRPPPPTPTSWKSDAQPRHMTEPAAASPKDGAQQPVTALQVKATELCHTYFTALGHLQNAAPEAPLDETDLARTARVAGYQGLVDELAAAVVQKHREIEGLVDELEHMPRSEEDELRRLHEAQEEHAAATERLRASVAKTGAPRHACRETWR